MVNTYQLDTLIQLGNTFTEADGVTVIDPTAVLLFITTPNGVETEYTSATTPAITRVSEGIYSLQIQTTQAGPWIYNWQGTGAVEITTGDQYFQVSQSAVLGVNAC